MAAGILAGALAGAGKAMQWSAQGAIEEKRQRALMALEQDNAKEMEGIRHQNTLERDEVQHGQRLDELGVRHGYSMEQERYRQGSQNARHSASLAQGNNDWQLVKTEDGGLVQYSPSRNTSRPANLPEGAQIGGSVNGELSDRAKYQLDGIQDRIEAIRTRASDEMRELTPEEKTELGRLQGQYDALLGGGGSQTPLQQLLAGEGGGAEGGSPGGQGGGAGGEPAPDTSARGLIQRRQEEARQREQDAAYDAEVDDALGRADALMDGVVTGESLSGPGLALGASLPLSQQDAEAAGVGLTTEQRQQGQALAAELMRIHDDPATSDFQKNQIMDRLQALQDAGVSLIDQ